MDLVTLDSTRTRPSLLVRLRDVADDAAWIEFTSLYEPLIYRLARTRGMQDADCREIVQTVLMSVTQSIRTFDVRAGGTFRGWLSRITRHATIDHFRRHQRIDQPTGDSELHRRVDVQGSLEGDPAEMIANQYDRLHRQQLFQHAASIVRRRTSETNWIAFWNTTVEDQSITQVATELGINEGAVYVARCRILQRIRVTVRELEDE